MAPGSWRKAVAQQQGEPPAHKITTRSMTAKAAKELPVGSTSSQERTSMLSAIGEDGKILVGVAVEWDRMWEACSRWPSLPNLGKGHKTLQIDAMSFGNDKAKDALRAVIDIIHGKSDNSLYRGADPRFLFYMVLIHESLGAPWYKQVSHNERPGSIPFRYDPFFPTDIIEQEIFDLAKHNKYLYRVKNWLSLAVVADKLELEPVKKLIRTNLVLFCKAERKDLPDEMRDSMKDNEWALIQELRLINDEMLNERLFYVERVFKALRLLSHQVEHMDHGILPTPEEYGTYQDYRVTACPRCYSVSSDDFHQGFLAARLWPLGPSSHTRHSGFVMELIRLIREIEEDTVAKAKHSLPSGSHGRDCNQLTHLYDHLRNLRKEVFR